MNVAVCRSMSRQAFFTWAEGQAERYEFDGRAPVAMTGGNVIHDRLRRRLHRLLEDQLEGKACEAFGPELGIATVGNAVRYPDALVTCTAVRDKNRLANQPVVVFEILSPGSSRIDRIVKVREYYAVATIRHYVIIEQDSIACTLHTRGEDGAWRVAILTAADSLAMPEIGVAFPLANLYAGTELAAAG